MNKNFDMKEKFFFQFTTCHLVNVWMILNKLLLTRRVWKIEKVFTQEAASRNMGQVMKRKKKQ